MAVELVKSGVITNADATPVVLNNPSVANALLHEGVGTVEFTATASIASIARLVRVPSNARISRVLLSCDAITSAETDVGVYKTMGADGVAGVVVDVDFFASAQSIATALINSDVTHEADAADGAAGFGRADVAKPLWQALGLSADPGIYYDIACTLTAAATGAGTVSLKVQYTV
jgi:hypothetical protein